MYYILTRLNEDLKKYGIRLNYNKKYNSIRNYMTFEAVMKGNFSKT